MIKWIALYFANWRTGALYIVNLFKGLNFQAINKER